MSISRDGVSMKDVATLAGVSVGTVSNVLNRPEVVAASTVERVEQAIKKLGWLRNESARQLRAGTSTTIGMVVMDIANPFFTDIVGGVEDVVYAHHHMLQIGNSGERPDREDALLETLERQRVRGVLLTPIGDLGDQLARLRRRHIPVVLVDRPGAMLDSCSVSVDDVEGGRLAVEHLVGEGHTRIAFVGGPGSVQQIRDRRIGAEIAAGNRTEVVLLTMSTRRLDSASGVAAAQEIVALPAGERPTAVFAGNDLVALGLLQGFTTYGVRVPADVAIVGYDDISFAATAAIPLSSIRQPSQQLGRRAAELLFEEIAAADGGQDHRHEHVSFTPELVVRRSSQGR
jgi:LacI family transcriptional regulator